MDREKQIALMKSAQERIKQQTRAALERPDVKAAIRKSHQTMMEMRSPPKA